MQSKNGPSETEPTSVVTQLPQQPAPLAPVNERTTLKQHHSQLTSSQKQKMAHGVIVFGKKLLVIAVINFCWSAYRIINYSFSFDDDHSVYETDKVHFVKCALGLVLNTISVVTTSLLCYAAFYADALQRNGRLFLVPYIIWQPIVISFEIGYLTYIVVNNKNSIPDNVVIYSIGCILLSALYFGVCLQMRYFRNVAKDNRKKLRNFVASTQETHSPTFPSSSYTSFKDVLPVY